MVDILVSRLRGQERNYSRGDSRPSSYAYLCRLSIDNYNELLQRIALICKIGAKEVTFDRGSEGLRDSGEGVGNIPLTERPCLVKKSCPQQSSAPDNRLPPSSVPIPALSIKEEFVITLVIVHVRVHFLDDFHISPWVARHLLRLALGLARGFE